MTKEVLAELRQRIGYAEDDPSGDSLIENMSSMRKLREACGWRLGDPDWADEFISLAEECGFAVNDMRPRREN